MSIQLGLRGRLLLAFFGISAFAALGATVAIYSFLEIGKRLNYITQHQIPSALGSQELSRQAERIIAAAPALLTASTPEDHKRLWGTVAAEFERLRTLLADAKKNEGNAFSQSGIELAVEQLHANLASLDNLVTRRLQAAERKKALLARLAETNATTQRLLLPQIAAMRMNIRKLQPMFSDSQITTEKRTAAISNLSRSIQAFLALQQAQAAASAINDLLLKATSAENRKDLLVLYYPLNDMLAVFDRLVNHDLWVNSSGILDPDLRSPLTSQLDGFREFVGTAPGIRDREIEIVARGEQLLKDNSVLSRNLTAGVDLLVSGAKQDIAEASREASSAQHFSTNVLIAAVALSLLSSILIVWLYVGRNVIARLTALSDSMQAIAGGNLKAALPAGGPDEIGRMSHALTVFRDTAVEVDEKNLREVAEARQRLIDAIESISEGFALYDAEDRLVLCNSRYREILYPGIDDAVVSGARFEAIVGAAVERGLIEDAIGREEEWIAERLEAHRNPSVTLVERRSPDRWIQISERRISGGGTVAVYSDITELKRREQDLSEKSTALEALSNKLAKYLAPQVYGSIFSGRQDVRIASQRKKLTICFSDIAGFTETTDKMESEELTQLLNQYLTEMSKIASDFGATIDKYVGDAILMFFGDPETRGVKEDAIACVSMALAMQKRMGELGEAWRSIGIETPLRCRIGIHTDYCTVGNFGSEDRMDYTIIGGAVNLAARLEQEAAPGAILISYETFAQVRDVIHCEEVDRILVKGIAYPIATHHVVDFKANLAAGCETIHTELPHLKLDAEPELMSTSEREEAVMALCEALKRLRP
jgi:adenylate cyclase